MPYAHHQAVVCSSVSDSVTDGNHFYNIPKKGMVISGWQWYSVYSSKIAVCCSANFAVSVG